MDDWTRFRFLPWLHGLAAGVRDDLTEETCRELSLPPAESVFARRRATSSIVVHHSASTDGSMIPFRVLHRAVFGWDDVGYHFIIGNGSFSGDGEPEPGRPEWAVGAHARSFNLESLGICLVGDFERTSPSGRQSEALRELLKALMGKYSIRRDSVILHREVEGCRTVCPGRNLDRDSFLAGMPD